MLMLTKYLQSPAGCMAIAYGNIHLRGDINTLSKRILRECGTDSSYALRIKAPLIYSLIRRHKPKLMVETGVQNGISTYFILKAMYENNFGKLISIDLPFSKGSIREYDGHKDTSWIPKGKLPGWVVPESLKSRWRLILGDSKDILPKLHLNGLDFFMHDSEHSYKVQKFEYEWAYSNILKGVIASDDIEWGSAWDDFLTKYNLPIIVYPYAYTIKE